MNPLRLNLLLHGWHVSYVRRELFVVLKCRFLCCRLLARSHSDIHVNYSNKAVVEVSWHLSAVVSGGRTFVSAKFDYVS